MFKLRKFFLSAFRLSGRVVIGLLVIAYISNFLIRSTNKDGVSEGIVFSLIKDAFFQKSFFLDKEENDQGILEDQKFFPGLSAILRVEKTSFPDIKEEGKGLQELDYWKVPNGFYICIYGPDLSEIPYPEGTGYMKTVLSGYRSTKYTWIIDEDFTSGIPSRVKAIREDNPLMIAEGKIVYQRNSK